MAQFMHMHKKIVSWITREATHVCLCTVYANQFKRNLLQTMSIYIVWMNLREREQCMILLSIFDSWKRKSRKEWQSFRPCGMCTKMNMKSRCGEIRRRKSISINMQSNDGGDRATEIFGMNFSSCIHGRSQVPVKRCSVHTYRKISFKRVLHNECDYNVPCSCERRGKFKYEKCTHEKKSCRKSNKQQTHSHVIHVCLMEFFFGDFQRSIMHQPTHFHIFTFFLQKFPLFW